MTIRAEQRAATRERIVEAAAEAFAEKGFRGASTRDIAQRAGTNQGLITYHFRSKDELWRAAADRIFGLLHESLVEQVAALEFDDPLGACLPIAVSTQECAACPGWCLTGCSGKEVHFPTLNTFMHGGPADSMLLGSFDQLFVGHATDDEARQAGASGGIISSLAIYMLQKRMVQGVIALSPCADHPWQFEPTIARSREEVLACTDDVDVDLPVKVVRHRAVDGLDLRARQQLLVILRRNLD